MIKRQRLGAKGSAEECKQEKEGQGLCMSLLAWVAESGEIGGWEGVRWGRAVEHDQGAVYEICTCSVWRKGIMMEGGK